MVVFLVYQAWFGLLFSTLTISLVAVGVVFCLMTYFLRWRDETRLAPFIESFSILSGHDLPLQYASEREIRNRARQVLTAESDYVQAAILSNQDKRTIARVEKNFEQVKVALVDFGLVQKEDPGPSPAELDKTPRAAPT